MPAIASDGIPIEKGQRLRLIPDGTEITVAWVDSDGTVTDVDGDEWNARELEHAATGAAGSGTKRLDTTPAKKNGARRNTGGHRPKEVP